MKTPFAVNISCYNVLSRPVRDILEIGEFFHQTDLLEQLNLRLGTTLQEKVEITQTVMALVQSYESFKRFSEQYDTVLHRQDSLTSMEKGQC